MVMLLLAGLGCGLSVIGWAYGLYEKPLKEQILRAAAGNETYECLKSEAVRKEEAQRNAFQGSAKMQSLSKQLTWVSAALAVATFGMFYLWSCLVVRIVKEKSNKALHPTGSPPASRG